MPSLSVCIVTRNAGALLAGCLTSIVDVADEVVVADVGSIDDSREIAAAVGARVIQIAPTEDESRARSSAASACTGDYVLVIEPNERLAPGGDRAVRIAMEAGVRCALLPIVEADVATADIASVARGEGRLGEPWLDVRLLRADVATRWRGAAMPRPTADLQGAPTLDAWMVGLPQPGFNAVEADEAWIRRAASAPGDSRVLAQAARHLRARGRVALAHELADRAWSACLAGDIEGVVSAATIGALVALDEGDDQGALARICEAAVLGASHPNLDLLEGLAGLELGNDVALLRAEAALRRALASDGRLFLERPIEGATGDAARIALATLGLATGRPDMAAAELDALSSPGLRRLPVRLARAEILLDTGEAEAAMQALMGLLEVAGADGWTLAAEASAMLGRTTAAAAFAERAEERAIVGFVAPHRTARLAAVQSRLAATVMIDKLCGDVSRRLDLAAPVAEGEAAFGAGAIEEAHACFIEALRRDPVDIEAWIDLGVTFHAGGAGEAAALALRTAVEIDPTNTDLRMQLAVVLWGAARPADAAAQARAAGDHVDAAGLLEALDVQGAPRPSVALVVPDGIVPACTDLVRAGLCRPVRADRDIVHALGGGRMGIRTWLRLADPGLLVMAESQHARDWAAEAAAQDRDIVWLGAESAVEGLQDAAGGTARIVCLDPADESFYTAMGGILDAAPPRRMSTEPPHVSVVIPTRDRADSLVQLLDRIAMQDVPPALLEVIVVDDGSATPIEPQQLGLRPWPITVIRQDHAGPAAARNRGLCEANGELVWFLDDDTRPAVDAARKHIIGHAIADRPSALVGDLALLERHRRTVWDHLLDTTPLHQGRPTIGVGDELSWRSFRVANTSVAWSTVQGVGNFDDVAFAEAGYEDAELGLRLADVGVRLVHRPDIGCGHDHRMDLDTWMGRARALGRAQVALRDRHPGRADVLQLGRVGEPDQVVLEPLRSVVEMAAPKIAEAEHALRRLGAMRLPADPMERADVLQRVRLLAECVGDAQHQLGLLDALSVGPAAPFEPRVGTTSVVLAHMGGNIDIDEIIAGLRRNTVGPVELVLAVRGGATSPMESTDVRIVRMSDDATVAESWNAGIRVANGDTVFLCDDDVRFTPGWRARMLEHMAAWPDIGIVSALGGRLDTLADAGQFASERAGLHAWPMSVPASRILVRRDVLDKIGGIDPDMGGLAGLDFALRARRSGFAVRQAGDVIIGASEADAAPTAAAHATFRARWGLEAGPFTRPRLRQAIVESRFDPHTIVPFARIPGAPLLLGRVDPGADRAQEVQREPAEEIPAVVVRTAVAS